MTDRELSAAVARHRRMEAESVELERNGHARATDPIHRARADRNASARRQVRRRIVDALVVRGGAFGGWRVTTDRLGYYEVDFATRRWPAAV